MLLPANPILNSHQLPLQSSSKFPFRPKIHRRISNSIVCSCLNPKRRYLVCPNFYAAYCQIQLFIEFANDRCDLYDLHQELVPYASAWAWQNAIVKENKELRKKGVDFDDCLIVLQHNPVYTLGAGSSEEFLNFDSKTAPFDLYRTERGGEVTYHGPGQIVIYPIINLRHYKMDLHWYLRALEEVIIQSLSSGFRIEASRIEGLTGVWVGNQKLAAIGIKVTQWITYHGLALNVTTDTSPFQNIVPCGIRDRQVGSIKSLLQENLLSEGFEDHVDKDCQLLHIAYESLMMAFSEVFQVELRRQPFQTKYLENSHLTAPMGNM